MAETKYNDVVRYIESMESAWVGKVIIGRRESDGLFHPGKAPPPDNMCDLQYHQARWRSRWQCLLTTWCHGWMAPPRLWYIYLK